MANLDRLYDALKQADAAGNKEDAQQLADWIRSEEATKPAQSQAAVQPLVKPEDTSFGERALGSLKQGFQSFGEASEGRELARLKDAGKLPEAATKMEAIKTNAAKPQAPTLSPSDIQRIAHEKGYLPAAMEVPSFVVEQILKSGPEMAESLIAGYAAGALTTAGVAMTPFAPAAPVAGAVAGALAGIGTYGYQQYGHFMERQALAKQAPEELDPQSARNWAAATAPIGFAVDKLTFGVGKFGKKAVADAVVEELAKRTTGQVIKETVKAGAKEGAKRAAIGVSEMPTEMLEQWAELHQAGLPTDTEEAKREIWDAGWSALAMGTGIGGISGTASGSYNKYKELRSIDNTVNEVNEAPPVKERPSRETKLKDSWSKLEAKGDELRKQREAQTLAGEKAAAEAEAATQTEAPIVAETEIPPVRRGRKAKVAPAVEEVVAEEAPPVKQGVLDHATLTSLGLNKNSNAYKELLGVDATTPEGLAFLDETLDSHTGKINETAVGDFIQGLNIQEAPDVNTQPPTVEPTADRDSVQALDERGGDTTEGAPQDLAGTLGTTGDNVGQPAGGAEPSAAPLTAAEANFDAVKAEYDKITANPKASQKQKNVINDKLLNAISQLQQAQEEAPAEVPAEAQAPQSTEVLKEDEPVVVQEPLPIEKQGRALAKELRALDPDHPLIDDLTAFDVNEETLALAQQNIDELKAQRGAKGQTTQGELRELSDAEKAAAADQDVENFVDKVYGPKEGVPESEARYLSEVDTDVRYNQESEDLDEKIVATTKNLAREKARLEEARQEHLDAHDELEMAKRNGGDVAYLEANYRALGQEVDRATARIQDIESELESHNLDRTIIDEDYKRQSKRARMFEAEDYDRLIESLIEDDSITRGQVAFFEALFKGDAKAALEAIVKLPLTGKQLQLLENGHPGKAFGVGGKQLFKWYRDLANQLLIAKVIPKKLILSKNIHDENVLGDYTAETDTVRLDAGRFLQDLQYGSYSDVVQTFLHEVVHSGTVNAMSKAMAMISTFNSMEEIALQYDASQKTFVNSKGIESTGRDQASVIRNSKDYKQAATYLKTTEGIAAKNLFDIFNYLQKEYPQEFTRTKKYGATNPLEMISEAQVNPRFQELLMSLELPAELASAPGVRGKGFKNLWVLFTDAVRRILHLPSNANNALSAVMANTAAVMRQNRTVRESTKLEEFGRGKIYRKYQTEGNVIASRKQQQADDALLRRTGTKPARPPKPLTALQRFATSPVQTSTEIMRKFRSYWASFDLAINKKIFDAMRKRGVDQKAIADAFYTLQVSQAVRTDAMADAFLERGDIKYDENIFKFVITKSNESMKAIRDRLDSLAKANGIKPEKIYAYASAAFIAKRSRGLKNANARLQRRVVQLVAQGKKAQAKKLYHKNYKLVNMTQSEIDAGLEFFNRYPEFNEIFDTWNDVREKVLDFAVEQGLLDADTRDVLLEVMDYVPFFLVEQLEAKAGPKEHAHGLIDTAKTIQKMKGSTKEINDVFDNMERWIKYTIRKGIQNRAAQEKIKLYKQELPDDIKELPRQKRSETDNTVNVWEDGKLKRYEFQGVDGETMVHGFTGLEPVVIPALSKYWITPIANFVRKSIVLQPFFSIIQIPQDAYNAWFSSGVKFPIMLPLQVAKEILLTPLGLSRARRRLKQTVTVGKHDFSREYERMDLDAKEEAKKISTFDKLRDAILSPLTALSMASDNVIRQAVYSQLMLETGDEALAINAAEEIINFRRSGYGQVVNIMRQMAPFVNANLEALHISLATMTGDSINPLTRKQAMLRLINAGGQAIAGTLIYVILMSDDDEYKKLDPSERGHFFILPNGYKIPLRNDIFTAIFKVLPEELYNRYIDESEDSTKMRKALASAFKKALAVPGGMPTAVSGMVESYMNIDTVTGRPIVGQAQQGLAPELQVSSKRTPQIARLLGELGGVSPMQVDHLLSRYFSTMYGITAMLTNSIIADMRGEVLPKKTAKDMMLEFPFVNSIVTKEIGARNIMDYYELQDVVNEAYKSYGDIQKTNTNTAVQAYLNQGNNRQLVLMEQTMKNISDELANLRSYENKLLLDKTHHWNAEEKRAELDRVEQQRQSMLGYQMELNDRKDRYIQQLRYQGGL